MTTCTQTMNFNTGKTMNFKSVRFLFSLLLALVSTNVLGQDLLARQAPIDRKLKAIDSIALIRQIRAEMATDAGYNLYPEWSNAYAHSYQNVTLPDSFVVDLTKFCMPTTNTRITDVFGYRPRRRRIHYGLDIKVQTGDTIRAAFDGRVRVVKNQGRRRGYGKYIIIRHENGLETLYGHLSKQLVFEDQYVEAGDVIGLGGNTGRSTGSHLHFETRLLGQALDPAKLFDFTKQDIVADTYLFTKNKKAKPGSTVTSGDGNHYYKVRKGDSLSRIAQRTGVSIRTLCSLNKITTKTILRPGQMLRCS